MGYDLRITRSTDWTSNLGQEIDSDHWLAVVREDVELQLDPGHGPFAVRWGGTWFDWFEGNVFTTDPSRATLTKMLKIAEQLDGVVQGDDGEFYESASQWNAVGGRAQKGQSPRE